MKFSYLTSLHKHSLNKCISLYSKNSVFCWIFAIFPNTEVIVLYFRFSYTNLLHYFDFSRKFIRIFFKHWNPYTNWNLFYFILLLKLKYILEPKWLLGEFALLIFLKIKQNTIISQCYNIKRLSKILASSINLYSLNSTSSCSKATKFRKFTFNINRFNKHLIKVVDEVVFEFECITNIYMLN